VSETLRGYDAWRTREPDMGPEPEEPQLTEHYATFAVTVDLLLPGDTDGYDGAGDRYARAWGLGVQIQKLIRREAQRLSPRPTGVMCTLTEVSES
jgi:hypothetical protein